jgi:UDP-N-acetylmuramyl-tripeptide synthetase
MRAQGDPGAPAALRAQVRDWLARHAAARADLRIDSRAVAAGDVFLALPGRRVDGLQFLEQAVARGAAAILVDAQAWSARAPAGAAPSALPVPVLPVPRLAEAAAAIASDHYGDPSAQLHSIGITGTNGKTSSCQWIGQVLSDCGRRCATLGTLGYGFPGALDATQIHLTTPDSVNLQRLARRALDEGARALATEVSSIALDQGRVAGFAFHVALFTNLTRDHLDYHADMAAYGAAKRRLFEWPTLDAAVLNVDDEFGACLAARLRAGAAPGARRPRVVAVGSGPRVEGAGDAWLRAEAVEHHAQGLRFTVRAGGAGAAGPVAVRTALLGDFNVQNLLGVLGVAWAGGIPLEDAAGAASRLQAPAGRLQRVPAAAAPAGAAAPLVIVDYAHTPDAIAQALHALRPLARARGGRLVIVFGAGGDRDPGKRPGMAAAAAAAADRIVLTSDNPRGEAAEAIIDQLAAGLPSHAAWVREADRGRAIELALDEAGPDDVVLLAGKGHEPYQEIAGRRLPFSDAEAAAAALRRRAGQAP